MITSSDVCGPGHQLSKLLLLEIPWRMKILDKASAEYNIHITHVEKEQSIHIMSKIENRTLQINATRSKYLLMALCSLQ